MTLISKMTAAEDGLLADLLSVFGAYPTVVVQLGDPGPQPPAEVIWIEENATADWDPDVTMGANPTMDEIYELHVKVITMASGDDYVTLRNRAATLTGVVTLAVASDRRLGNSVDDSYVTQVQRSTGAWDTGRGIETRITIRARSSLV